MYVYIYRIRIYLYMGIYRNSLDNKRRNNRKTLPTSKVNRFVFFLLSQSLFTLNCRAPFRGTLIIFKAQYVHFNHINIENLKTNHLFIYQISGICKYRFVFFILSYKGILYTIFLRFSNQFF